MEENKVNSEAVEDKAAEVQVSEAVEADVKTEEKQLSPEEVNAANAATSTGRVTDDGRAAAFFTAADVRAMTREQVRTNLDRILLSMRSDKFM